ncbi:MAG: polysaccharide biosynthesis/export family protein, partial [Candidatus Rokuibacteriota bacterium]
MRFRKLLATMTLVALVGSDFVLAALPALGQTPTQGNGHPATPTLGGSDSGYGRMLPGPSTTAPYVGTPQVPSQLQMIQRPAGPAGPNLCQSGGGPRAYQTVSMPRSRPTESLPFQPGPQGAPVAQGATVTQVTVSQGPPGSPGQASQPSTADVRTPNLGQAPGASEVEELSRIEAGFNLDTVRVQQIGSIQQQVPQSPSPSQPPAPTQQLSPSQTNLGPFGSPLRQYGYSMFAASVSTFAPVDDIPVGPDYVLGPGDDLTINVWGAVDSTLIRTVDRNGRIVLPKVGDLRIWGLTFSQADRLIRDELARFFRGFRTSVTMGRLRTVSVHVVGEVCQPGVYTLSSLATVTNALYSAGGPTKLGSLREVRLLRSNVQVARIDLYDFLQRGDRTR